MQRQQTSSSSITSGTCSSTQGKRRVVRALFRVWYLKLIDFTSPSGETHTYNVITQNYNRCVHIPDSWHTLTTEQTMFVHRDMQYPNPPRTDRDTSPRSQERVVRIPCPTRRRTYSAHRTRPGRVCSAIDDAANHQ